MFTFPLYLCKVAILLCVFHNCSLNNCFRFVYQYFVWQLKWERPINTSINIIVPTDKSSNVYVINPSSTEYHRLMTKSTQHCQSWYEAAVQRTPEARPGKKTFIPIVLLNPAFLCVKNEKFTSSGPICKCFPQAPWLFCCSLFFLSPSVASTLQGTYRPNQDMTWAR